MLSDLRQAAPLDRKRDELPTCSCLAAGERLCAVSRSMGVGMGDDAMLDHMLEDKDEAKSYRRVELIMGRRQRRHWTAEEKARIVEESSAPGVNISDVARRYGVNRGLLSVWRRQALDRAGDVGGDGAATAFIPVAVGDEQPVAVSDRHRGPGRPGGGGSASGRIEFDLRSGRLVFSGGVDPGLAAAIIGAARSR